MDVKAHVMESAEGEISCSVEETNRIRAMLGMRPLDLGPSKAERAVVDVRVDKEKAAAEDDARRRIERARKEREASGHSAGAPRGLGDVLPEKKMSAAQWVALSRTAPAAPAAPPPARKPHGGAGAVGSEISGARIAHGADEFEPGEEGAILTLKDTGLLDVSGKGLAGEGAGGGADELYSEDLLAREKAADRAERKRRATQPAYSGVDDEEFGGGGGAAVGGGGGGAAVGGAAAAAAARQKALLFQYDEEDVYDPRGSAAAAAAARTAAKGLVIGSNGAVTDVAAADRVRARLAAASGPQAIDISSAGLGALLGHPAASAAEAATRAGSDYRTAREEEAERAAAAATAARARQARKKKRLRGREAEPDGDGEEADAGAGAGAQPATQQQQQQSIAAEITGHVTDARDRGSRAARRGMQAGAEGAGGPAAAAAGDAAATARLQAQLQAAGAAGAGAGLHVVQPTYLPGAIVPDDVAFAPSAAAGALRGSGSSGAGPGAGPADAGSASAGGHGAVGSGGAVDVASLSRQQREELSAFQQRGRAYDAAVSKAAARTQQAFGRGGEAPGDAGAAEAGAAAGGASGEEEAVAAPAASFLLPAASAGLSGAGESAASGYSAVSRQRIYARLRPGAGGGAAERGSAVDRGEGEGEEDDDAELAAMLAKARRMAHRAEAPSAAAAAAAAASGAGAASSAASVPQRGGAGGAGGAGVGAGSVKEEDAGARAILEQLAFRGRGGHGGSTNGAASVIKPDVGAGAAANGAANGGGAGAFPGVLRAQVMDVDGQPSSPAAGAGGEGGSVATAAAGGFGADVDGEAEEGGSGGGLVFTNTTEFASLLHARLGERQRFRDEQAGQQAAESTAAAAASSATAAAAASRVREAAAAAAAASAGADASEGSGGAADVGLKRKRSRWDAGAGAGAGAGGSAEDGAGPSQRRRTEESRARHGVAIGGEEGGGGGGWRQHADGDSDAEEEGSGSEGGASDEEGGGGRRRGRDDEEEDGAIAGMMGHREPRVARGVASALTLFRELGALQQEERYSGRAKDANVDYDAPIPDGLGSSIVLDYRDEHGNKMTTKQAYRELSYRFHGRKPSQKSRDRRQRQEERRTAQLKAGSSDTPLGTAAALHRTQEALGQAHITLSRK